MKKIAIASGKGGTGKTTVSVNLAAMLSEKHHVLLCDMDVEEPDASLFLNPLIAEEKITYRNTPQWDEEKCTLCGKCQQNCNFNAIIRLADQIMVFPELCHSCYACSELCPENALPMVPSAMGKITSGNYDKLKTVEARLNVGVEQAVPLIEQAHEYIGQFSMDTEIAIIDSPPGTSCPMIHAVKECDYAILVTEPTPFGLHDLRLAVETTRQLGLPFGVVINRGDENNTLITDYCEEESIQLLAIIGHDKDVAKTYAGGGLIYNKVEGFRESLNKLADHLEKTVCK